MERVLCLLGRRGSSKYLSALTSNWKVIHFNVMIRLDVKLVHFLHLVCWATEIKMLGVFVVKFASRCS